MADGNWWEDFDASLPEFQLSAERLAMVPWAPHAGRQSRPPAHGRSRSGGRLCELCGAAYLGNRECAGGARCPRHHSARRRELEWHHGFWLPTRLVVQWRIADEETRAREGGAIIIPAGPVRPPPKPPPPAPAPFAVACLPKPPPWGVVRAGFPPAATEPPRKAPPDPRLMVKQPPTRSQLSAYTEEQATKAGRRAEREAPPPEPLAAWVPSDLIPSDVPSRGPPHPASSSAGVSCGSAARGGESCAGAPSEGEKGAGKRAPFPEPLSSAFIGQDDTVVAPDEYEDVNMVVDPVAPVVLEARRLIGELGVEVARHLVQEGAPQVCGYSHPPIAQEPARGAGRGGGCWP